MKFLKLRWKKFSAVLLALVLAAGMLSGCGSSNQPSTGGPVRAGQTVTVGGCQVQLRSYNTMAQYIGDISEWENTPVMMTVYVYNQTMQSVKVGDYSLTGLESWMYGLRGKTEAQYQEEFSQMVNAIEESARKVSVNCGGEPLDCFTVGSNANNMQDNMLSFGDMGGFNIICNLPKGWGKADVTYTLNGEAVTFEISPLDILA